MLIVLTRMPLTVLNVHFWHEPAGIASLLTDIGRPHTASFTPSNLAEFHA